MNEDLKELVLDFNNLALVDDVYQFLDEELYTDIYKSIKDKRETKSNTRIKKIREIKGKITLVIFMILNFLNNIFIRLCGFLIISVIVSLFHSEIHEKSFELFSQYGMKIYDFLFSSLFHMSSNSIFESSYNDIVGATSLAGVNSSYMLFYAIFLTTVLFLAWVIKFIVMMSKKEKIESETVLSELSEQSSLLLLGCDKYDGFEYVKKQLAKKYIKNQSHRSKQLECIKAYIFLFKNKKYINQEILDDRELKIYKLYVIRKSIIHVLNWICNGIVFAGLFVLVWYRFFSFFVAKGYIDGLWSYMNDIHNIFHGGILSFFSLYKEAPIDVQVVLSSAFVFFLVILCIRFYKLVIVPICSIRIRYKHYLIDKKENKEITKFSDKYGIHWLVLVCIVAIILLTALYLDTQK